MWEDKGCNRWRNREALFRKMIAEIQKLNVMEHEKREKSWKIENMTVGSIRIEMMTYLIECIL